MKLLTVVGARPQFIKAATLSRAISRRNELTEIMVHTGQHFDENMSDIFFRQLSIRKPDYNLNIASLSHGAMTGKMLEAIEEVVIREKPDWVIVYGDTNSTLAGALAAAKLNIRVAHIEAGLRSGNMSMPEEQNRILTDSISSALFCPTKLAVSNLRIEGYEEKDVLISNIGDVMFDAVRYYESKCFPPHAVANDLSDDGFALATIHRAENTDDPEVLKNIIEALNRINNEMQVVAPLHPRTRGKIAEYNLKTEFKIIDPVSYLEILYLIKGSSCVLTDSGGLQKESYFLETPCITLRNETEWMELVECGANILCGTEVDAVLDAFQRREVIFKSHGNLYGSANAAELALNELIALN